MANAFNLTAQLNLRGPANLKPVIGQMRKELSSLNANIKINIDKSAVKSIDAIRGKVDGLNAALTAAKINAKDLTVIFRDLQSSLSSNKGFNIGGGKSLATTAASAQAAAKNLNQATTAIEEFGQKSALAFKRFAAYTIATSGIFALVNAVNQGVKAFIEFERRLIQLRQVTGSGAVGIASLEKEITGLATTLGVSSDSLAQVAITLAQAGLSANETRIALAALAKTDLAPSFDNLTDTTEGAIAALRQFGLEATDLEDVLGSINAVAAKFAVESGDIIAAIQRTGGVFASASKGVSQGKDALNEFIAVFTSVRATTRESAETIATGLRTIFTRIQRAKTIDQLKEFGVNLQDLEGKFVGPFEAVKRLSLALNQLDPRDIRFSTIVEELGGFRQIGKVIPLIQQFATAQEALKVAQQGAGSLAEDQVLAQQSLANQIAKVREQFLALIRDVGKSTTFQVITKTILTLTSGLISLAGAFKPILPILGILGTIKGISAISQFATGFFGLAGKGGGGGAADTGADTLAQSERERAEATNRASDVIRENTTALNSLTGAVQSLESAIKSRGTQTLNGGGKVLAFARGGYVPGSGNRDTVPAMLQPGEFVIRKKAVDTIGAGNLQKMNKYALGGRVSLSGDQLSNTYKSLRNKVDPKRTYSATVDPIAESTKSIKPRMQTLRERNPGYPNWKLFEYAVADKRSLRLAGGNKFLDYPSVLGEAKFLAPDSTYGQDQETGFLKGNNNETMLAKLVGSGLYENNATIRTYYPQNINDFRKFMSGGIVQKFANGGEAEYYGRAEVEAAKAAVAEYQKSIAEAFNLENIYFDTLEGKSIADGITPEVYGTGIGGLAKGQPGVIGNKRVSFTKAETAQQSVAPDTKALKAAALAARQSQLQAYTDAEESIAAFKKTGVLTNISPDILSYIQNTISNLQNSILDPDSIESIQKKLTRPNVAALEGLLGSQQKVEVQGQRTKLAEVFNTILETYGSDVSVKEIDSISAALGKKLSGGGLISKFIDGGLAQTLDSSEIIRFVEELGGPQTVRGLLGVDKINAAIRQISGQTGTAAPTAKQLFSQTFLGGKNSGPYLGTASELLKEAKLAVKQPRVFTEEEKANATKLAVVGMSPFDLNETKFEELAGRIVSLNLATLKSDKAPAVMEMKAEIDKVLGRFASNLGGTNLTNLDDTTKEAMGLGNLEGYMIEAVLAKLGANPGKLDDRSVDYAQGLGPAASLFGVDPNIPTEVKRDVRGGLSKARENFTNYFKKFADGGSVGSNKNFGQIALRTGNRIQATYMKEGDAATARSGQVIADKIGNSLYAVQSSSATKGYGPKLYDIVMEAATAEGAMLTSDRRTVSDAARAVWAYYFNNRSDVKKTQLDPENWVSNNRLLDPKLYGPPDTWPSPSDAAWILQSGYSKSPSDINNPQLVKKFAKGGSAEDTVPALLTPGEFVINKKAAKQIGYAKLNKLNHADKMQGYNRGGVVGGIRGFRAGGEVTPNERAASNVIQVIRTLEASGTGTVDSINRLEDIVGKLLTETIDSKTGIYETAQIIKELRTGSSKSDSDQISTLNNIISTIKSTGDFQSAAIEKQNQAIEKFVASRGQTKTIVGQFPPAQPTLPTKEEALAQVEADRQKTLENIAQAAFAAGKGLETFIGDLEEFYNTVKQNQLAKMQEDVQGPLTLSQTKDASLKATAATEQAFGVSFGDYLANDFESLSNAIKEETKIRQEAIQVAANAREEAAKQAEEYKNSGQAFRDFGTVGTAMPGQAKAFGESKLGGRLLAEAKSFQQGPKALQGLVNVLDKMPGPIGNMVRSIGGIPGVVSVAASALGSDLLPQLGKLAGLSKSVGFAGLSGALAEGGSMAASLGTIGQQFAGPIAGMIGTIGGAVAGAINGFFKGVRTKTLENSLSALGKSSEEARKSLEKLAKTDSAENAQRASAAVGKLQSNVNDLGIQAQRTSSEQAQDALGGAATGATYAGIGATALLASTTAAASAGTIAAAAPAAAAIVSAVPGIAAIGAALAPLSGGTSLLIAGGIIAIGTAIGAAAAYFSGPNEIDDEALKAQLEAIGQYLEGINQLGERRLTKTNAEDLGKFLDDLQNAGSKTEKFDVASRGAFVQEAQRAALTRQFGEGFIKDDQSVQDVTATNSSAQAVAQLAEQRYYEQLALDELNRVYKGNIDKIREESADKQKLIQRGKELNLAQTESAAKQAALAKAALQVQRAMEGFLDVFKNINAGIKRFAEESEQYISDVESSVSGLLGSGQLRNVNRENERILANPLAYSEDEVRRAGATAGGLGGGAEGQQIGNIALASKLIEERLPALLRGLGSGPEGSARDVIGEIEGYFKTAGIDTNNELFGGVLKEITKSIEAVAGGGEGASIDETLLKDLIPQISKILESGREVALNIQKEYNDTLQRTIDLQNKANALILKANENQRKAQQIRLNSEIQLSEKLGKELSLEQLNKPFETNIQSLTGGLIEGGSQDPAQIAQAIIDSNKQIAAREERLTQSRNAVGLVGGANTQAGKDLIAANAAEQKAIAEQVVKTQEASQALDLLASSGDLAANALKVFDQVQGKVNGFTGFIDNLLTAGPEEVDQILKQQQAANQVLTGGATKAQLRDTTFRQQASAGINSLRDVLSPEDFRRSQAQFRRQSLEALGVNLQQQTNIKDEEGNALTLDALLKRAENPEESPAIKAAREAAERQATASESLASVQKTAADQYTAASNQIISFFQSQFGDIVRSAFAEVRGIEAEARAAETRGPEAPKPISQTRQDLAAAEAEAKKSRAIAARATENRKAQEESWFSSAGATEIARRQEKDALKAAGSDQAEVERLKKLVAVEQAAAAMEASLEQTRQTLAAAEEKIRRQEADMVAAPPSARMGIPATPVNLANAPTIDSALQNQNAAADNQNAAATQLNVASTALATSAQSLSDTTAGMRASGGTAGTTANIPGARATVAAATTVQNREEIEQQLFLRLDEGTQRFLGDFNTSLATTFTTFGRDFGNYITRLEQIKIPEKIEMTGRHTVDVRVTGAAGFDNLQDGIKNMIVSAVTSKMNKIWNQSNGELGERPA